ncbi:MAG: cation:proton antiporter [Gemmatimonadetes bacterium]|nr:cation:proton antiporter [Gemmatimonadota bacterium]
MGWDGQVSLLFGTLVAVTGPTVINPLTRRIGLRQNLRTILEAEGVLIDPLGAILAVVALEVTLATTAGGVGAGVLGLPTRLGLGLVIGLAGGLAIGGLLRFRRVVPGDLQNVFTLALVLALFQISNAILPESGIMTVAIAGLVVGNMSTHRARELVEFKEQLTSMLVGLLFVLLAAAVELSDVAALGLGGVATVALLILVVRPLDIWISTRGSDLSLNEQAFLAWLAPRGIVAFAVSSLFATELAHYGMVGEGEQLRAMVFLVIAVTVVVQGGTGGLVARLLNVRRPSNHGFAIVGANPVGRALGRALRDARTGDGPIVLLDTNPGEVQAAEAEGFRAVLGNASESRTLRKAGVDARRGLIALTPNEGVNLLLANRAHEANPDADRLVAIDPTDPGVEPEQVHESGAHVLFGRGMDYERWAHEFRHDRVEVAPWTFGGESGTKITALPMLADTQTPLLALVHRRGKTETPVSDLTDLRPLDQVWFAWLREHTDAVERIMSDGRWAAGDEETGAD